MVWTGRAGEWDHCMGLACGGEEWTRAHPRSGWLTGMGQSRWDQWCPATAVPGHCHRVHLLHGHVGASLCCTHLPHAGRLGTARGALPEDGVPGGCQELPQPGTGREHCGHDPGTVGTRGPANPRRGPQNNPSTLQCPRSRRGAVSQQHSAEAPRASEPSTAGDLRHGTRTKRKPINYTCADCIWRTVLRLSDTKSLDPPARPSAYALRYGQV